MRELKKHSGKHVTHEESLNEGKGNRDLQKGNGKMTGSGEDTAMESQRALAWRKPSPAVCGLQETVAIQRHDRCK